MMVILLTFINIFNFLRNNFLKFKIVLYVLKKRIEN